MSYIVNDKCVNCRYGDCVEVCPVDCFHVGENMVVINPDNCIDCGVCEAECPVNAIESDTIPGNEKWLELNRKYSNLWPSVSVAPKSMENAKEWEDITNKIDHLSPNPCKEID